MMSAFSHKLSNVTYPRMERQDLTQTQLGSFKFTPTDEVRHVFASTSPVLAPQLHSSFGKPPKERVHVPRLNTAVPNNTYAAQCSPSLANSPTRFNSTFFDTFIKPDLAKSRLRYGPNTLRAAVDGSPTPSPPKNFIEPQYLHKEHSGDTMFPVTASQIDGQSFPNGAEHPAPRFTPTSTTAEMDMTLLHNSLIQALANEQAAHLATKEALEIERAENFRINGEIKKLIEVNRSLAGSVNMLKSLVQHNVKKGQDAAQMAAVTEFHNEVKAAGQPRTILHDALKKLRSSAKAPTATKALYESIEQPTDENSLFDFDLLEKLGPTSLRKHFSTPEPELKSPTSDAMQVDTNIENVAPFKAASKSSEARDIKETAGNGASRSGFAESGCVASVNRTMKPIKVMEMPYDVRVQWTQVSIFKDDRDKNRRIGHDAPLFTRHPVRYIPEKSDKNLYRTIMMDFLPMGTTYKEVLETVRGGNIESIQLYGPIGGSTHFMTARIVFNYELGARGVYLRAQSHGIEIRGEKIRVWQVLEATYPRNEDLEREIFEERFTRLLLVENAVPSSLEKLPQKLSSQVEAGFVIEIGKACDGLPMIEFTSIAECSKALKQLMSDPDFGGSRFDFEEDPCSDPY